MSGLPADLNRFLFLVPYVAAHREGVRADVLAEMLSMDLSDMRRLLDRVAMVGAPDGGPDEMVEIYLEGEHVFVALPQRFTRPPRFSVEEMAALLLALAPLQGLPVLQARARRLSDRLVSLASERAETLAPALRERLAVRPDSDDDPAILRTLEEAITSYRPVEGRYYSAGRDAVSERRIKPVGLLQVRGCWYVADSSAKVFRVDRFESLELTDDSFEPADVDLGVLRNRLEQMEFGGSPVNVTIDGEALTTESFASAALRRWIRLYRGRAELQDPAHERAAIAEEAALLAARYQPKTR